MTSQKGGRFSDFPSRDIADVSPRTQTQQATISRPFCTRKSEIVITLGIRGMSIAKEGFDIRIDRPLQKHSDHQAAKHHGRQNIIDQKIRHRNTIRAAFRRGCVTFHPRLGLQ